MSPQDKLEILVDTREQMPWTFSEQHFRTTRATLPAGDYSLPGLEMSLALERKNLGDFVSTVIQNWLRFRKELIRLSGYDLAAVVVEANLSQIVNHQYESEASPASVLGRMDAIFLDHGIPVFLWGDRVLASQKAGQFLRLAWRKHHGR